MKRKHVARAVVWNNPSKLCIEKMLQKIALPLHSLAIYRQNPKENNVPIMKITNTFHCVHSTDLHEIEGDEHDVEWEIEWSARIDCH